MIEKVIDICAHPVRRFEVPFAEYFLRAELENAAALAREGALGRIARFEGQGRGWGMECVSADYR